MRKKTKSFLLALFLSCGAFSAAQQSTFENTVTPEQAAFFVPQTVHLDFEKIKDESTVNIKRISKDEWLVSKWKVWEKLNDGIRNEDTIGIHVTLYGSSIAAKSALSRLVAESSGLTETIYNGKVIGERCCASSFGGGIHFSSGRAVVNISIIHKRKTEVEALAHAIWFRLLSHPEISAAKTVRVPVQLDLLRLTGNDAPLKMGKSLWLPLMTWRKLGVQVEKNSQTEIFELTYKGKTLVLSPYSANLTVGERTVKSETALFVENENDGVPLEPVASALGIRVVKLPQAKQ